MINVKLLNYVYSPFNVQLFLIISVVGRNKNIKNISAKTFINASQILIMLIIHYCNFFVAILATILIFARLLKISTKK